MEYNFDLQKLITIKLTLKLFTSIILVEISSEK